MKTIGIVGSRRRDSAEDCQKVWEAFDSVFEPGDIICSGLCGKGADRFAAIFAFVKKAKTKWFPAEWHKYGKAAGFIRNTDIARESDVLIACVAPDRKGGTEDTIKKFVQFHGKENLILVE